VDIQQVRKHPGSGHFAAGFDDAVLDFRNDGICQL
jgi:hypothetical protein